MKNAARIFLFLSMLIAPVFSVGAAFAGVPAERILRYESLLSVAEDASATVTERLTFNIEGEEIKRGIERFFPVAYRTPTGGRIRTGFEFLSATFDGQDVPHKISRQGDYAVMTIGDKRVMVPKGEHVYELVFRVTGHVRFLDDRDGIYWNVTGNQWAFPIDYASFRLELPAGGEGQIIGSNAYTGYAGEEGADFRHERDVFFETTRPLREKEGFTVAVDWEKGVVAHPVLPLPERFAGFLSGNRIFAAAFLPLLALLYFLPAWFFFGRDPALGVVVPAFDPPDGIEPAIAALIRNMKFVPECLTANLTQMAVLGFCKFGFDEKGGVRVTKISKPLGGLPNSLSTLWNKLFLDNENASVSFSPKGVRDARVLETYQSVAGYYKKYEDMGVLIDEDKDAKKLYRRNLAPSWLGFALFAVCLWVLSDYYPFGGTPDAFRIASGVPAFDFGGAVKGLFSFYAAFLIVGFVLLRPGLRRLGNLRGPRFGAVKKFMMMFFGALLSLVGALLLIELWNVDAYLTAGLLASWGVFHLFRAKLMPVRTAEGVEMLRQVEGLRMYVNAEKEFLAQINAPEDTAERYEKILPYAIALDAADKWNARFAPILENYKPEWSGLGIAETLAELVLFNKGNRDLHRYVRYIGTPSVLALAGSAVWHAAGGTSGGSSGGGSGGGGGRGW